MRRLSLILASVVALSAQADPPAPTAADWPMYNHDVRGWRFNNAEVHLGPENVGQLVEKWRFPPAGSDETLGVIHMTPVVVNGYVYFGTATGPAFYKLSPNGQVKWVYRNLDSEGRQIKPIRGLLGFRDAAPYFGSPLVTDDSVYFGDYAGWIFGLDRVTGEERWKIDTRAENFPGAHSSNVVFSSPILADGKVIVTGGAFEHSDATGDGYECCRGRGYVLALEPRTGRLLWKYNVGPEPERFDPPLAITDARGEHVFHYGPSTSSVWCTPSYDEDLGMIFFGTDVHNSPRKPTADDPKLYTPHSAAVVALDARTGTEKWVTQVNADDVWNYNLRAYDPVTGLYKDQSIGDTPKIYAIDHDGEQVKVVGCGCKNGGYYVIHATDGRILAQTPVYHGKPGNPLDPAPEARTLALPGPIGGLQTGCATDGRTVFTNGIDAIMLLTGDRVEGSAAPTGGRVTAIRPDAEAEFWRHERPRVESVGGWRDVGDPVGSGIAVANGVAFFTTTVSNKLIALDTSSGKLLKEIDLGPVWCGPSVSRGRVYVGTGNLLFSPADSYFPKRYDGTLYSFGLPGEDEVERLGEGNE